MSQRHTRVRFVAVAVLAAVLVSSCSETSVYETAGHSLWGPPSEAEVAEARELQQAYVGGSTDVFPPIDPDAPCPEGVPDGDTHVVVYRVRRGCLWSQEAHEAWFVDGSGPDIERHFESDPFIVAVAYASVIIQMSWPTSNMVLAQTAEYRCHREVLDYLYPVDTRWSKLEQRYRSEKVVRVPFFSRFPGHEDAPECPPWVALAPGQSFLWGPPGFAEAARARELQARFVGRSPDEWPPLPEAASICPAPRSYEYHRLTVFRFRQGCLLAESGPIHPDLSGPVEPWNVYDYESDPWAIWACFDVVYSAEYVGCNSDLPHNARIAELLETHPPTPHRTELSEHR